MLLLERGHLHPVVGHSDEREQSLADFSHPRVIFGVADEIRHPRRVRGTDARRNGTGPARGEGLSRTIMMARLGVWTRMWRWMWAGRGWRRRRDQLVVRSVHILHACGPLGRRIVACGRQRRMRRASLEVLREKRRRMGEEGLLEPRCMGGDATCGEIDTWMERTWWRDGWRRGCTDGQRS